MLLDLLAKPRAWGIHASLGLLQGNKGLPGTSKTKNDLAVFGQEALKIIEGRPKGVFAKWVERQCTKICRRPLPVWKGDGGEIEKNSS